MLKTSSHKMLIIRVCFCLVTMHCSNDACVSLYYQQYKMEQVELGIHKAAMNLACLPVQPKPTERKLFIIMYYYYYL